jgi:hypothetical protein
MQSWVARRLKASFTDPSRDPGPPAATDRDPRTDGVPVGGRTLKLECQEVAARQAVAETRQLFP